jgi:hypothetical protein
MVKHTCCKKQLCESQKLLMLLDPFDTGKPSLVQEGCTCKLQPLERVSLVELDLDVRLGARSREAHANVYLL